MLVNSVTHLFFISFYVAEAILKTGILKCLPITLKKFNLKQCFHYLSDTKCYFEINITEYGFDYIP